MLRTIFIKVPKIRTIRPLSTVIEQEHEPTEKVKYPRILAKSFKLNQMRAQMNWYEKIKQVPTIEEKIIELNMPRYYGYKCLMLKNDEFYPYNSLPFIQYSTKTNYHELPLTIEDPVEAKKVDDFYNLIKADLLEAVEFELTGYKHAYETKRDSMEIKDIHRIKSKAVVKQLNRVLTRTLGADNGHLYEADVDYDPRIEAFWFVGGKLTSRIRSKALQIYSCRKLWEVVEIGSVLALDGSQRYLFCYFF